MFGDDFVALDRMLRGAVRILWPRIDQALMRSAERMLAAKTEGDRRAASASLCRAGAAGELLDVVADRAAPMAERVTALGRLETAVAALD